MTDSEGEELSDLPPSAKLVYKVLEYNGPMTQKDIVEESMLSFWVIGPLYSSTL